MGKGNQGAKKILEQIYGKICMIEEAGIRTIPVEQRRKIKGYRKTDETITYHHIRMKSKGGQATVENGALVKSYNHQWLNTLSEKEQEEVNEKLIAFKAMSIQTTGKGLEVIDSATIDFDMSDCIEIPVYDITEEVQEKRKKFNRAKVKRETQKLIEDEFDR